MVENCFNELSTWDYSWKTSDPIIFKKEKKVWAFNRKCYSAEA